MNAFETKYIRLGSIIAACVVLLLIVSALASTAYYVVEPNEVAAVTRMGQLISTQPVPPGLHFKAPIIDTAHKVRTSIEVFQIPKIQVKTIDNQFAQISVALSYKTHDPFKVLFQVGDVGPGSIEDKIIPFVKSRTLDVFGRVNALEISDHKKNLEREILVATQTEAESLFGEEIEDVQITNIGYDETFEKNIQETVKTRNQQVAAQNILAVRQIEAQQVVATAKGNADAAAANADGQKRVQIAQAEAEAQKVRLNADAAAYDIQKRADAQSNATKLLGEADGQALAAKIKSVGSADAYQAILRAEASKLWNGTVPNVQLGESGPGKENVVVLPLPAASR